ncbi:hypothetical protein ANCDUO_16141 [Ancylostoma duodenale]|uniref:Uncharacterized protein n=1 Tax=Ancylostoma duodenale TaxID=51022 RepID=A0A0C2G462_9BILA|nr:hypothetical protein ANCDUO_16141 [Ancylostoma duodenale]
MKITVDGSRPRVRPKTRWLDRIDEGMRLLKLTTSDAFDRRKWRNHTRHADPNPWENGLEEVYIIKNFVRLDITEAQQDYVVTYSSAVLQVSKFALYLLTGQEFRDCLRKVITHRRHPHPALKSSPIER